MDVDLIFMAAQLSTAAQQAGPALDLGSKAAEVGVTTNILTNVLKGVWGGDVRAHPPDWFAPVCAVVLGVALTAVAAVAIGINLGEARTLAGVLLAGIPLGSGTSFAVQGVSNAVRPKPMPPTAPALGSACPTCGQLMGGPPWTSSIPSLSSSSPAPSSLSSSSILKG